MSYIKKRIEENRARSAEFRAAYDEEVELLAREKARRQEVMRALASIRKSRHITQEAVAAAMGITQARVSQLERGAESLSVDSLLKLTEVLGVRMEFVTEDDAQRLGLVLRDSTG